MTQEQWTAVDDYISQLFLPDDDALIAALQYSSECGLPEIQVAPNQGKMLMILARLMNARRILEIGTLGGYSTIWLARALRTDGKLISLEFDPHHAKTARTNLGRAALSELVEVRVGAALETLPVLAAENAAPFDFVFIDADKENYAEYFAWAMKLTRKGGLIVADNVVRNGEIVDENSEDPRVQGMRRFNSALAAETRAVATQVQTVGSKGYDGFAMVLVVEDSN